MNLDSIQTTNQAWQDEGNKLCLLVPSPAPDTLCNGVCTPQLSETFLPSNCFNALRMGGVDKSKSFAKSCRVQG